MPERKNEWDARHFWRVSNAEQLAMSDGVGMVNLSHFAIFDVSGPDAENLMEHVCVARVGGSTPSGKGVYTHFLDAAGGIQADLTVIRQEADHYRVVCGGDTGHRDYVWMKRMAQNRGWKVRIDDRCDEIATLGVWGPRARETLQKVADRPEALGREHFPFAATRHIRIRAIRI